MSNFRFDGGDLLSNLAQSETRFKASMELYAENSSKKLENYAKKNKPWKNRTHDARNRLNGDWRWQGKKIILSLSHGVDYGICLEKGTRPHSISSKRASHHVKKINHPGTKPYPIIMPTIEKVGPQIMSGLTILLSR